MEETAQNFKNRLFKQILDFYCHSEILCHTYIEIMKFCQNHWSLVLNEILTY
jgi:hypothetical protein